MSARLYDQFIFVIDKVIGESGYDFSKWWQDDFETDYGYTTEEELREFDKNDRECVIHDWVYWVIDSFVVKTLEELGITSMPKTNSQQIIIEEIYDMVKDKLVKKIYSEMGIVTYEVWK